MLRQQLSSSESLVPLIGQTAPNNIDLEDNVINSLRNELERTRRHADEASACRSSAHSLLQKFLEFEELADEKKENVRPDRASPIAETPQVRPREMKPRPIRQEAGDGNPAPSTNECVSLIRPIGAPEFQMIPSYQKGRMGPDDLNRALSVLEKLWLENNKLMRTHPRTLTATARNRKIALTTQAAQAEGSKYFCSEKDWRDALDSKLRALSTKILPCLRHVARVKAIRLKNAVVLIAHVEDNA
uniref:SKA complex subunit 1 n=1 Tax=Steinernema glaseri TaxID=37863 RepID=A0A1I7ZK85_9BILA